MLMLSQEYNMMEKYGLTNESTKVSEGTTLQT